ncbi:MAG: glycosyltransferase family 4 protein [Verrucomicrobiota bacterium]
MTMSKPRIERLVFVSVTPSPYQRDVFNAIAARGRLGLQVLYQERTPPDSPWPEAALADWESILPGFVINWRGGRSHCNHGLPEPQPGDFWVVNGSMSDLTTQLLMRRLGTATPWAFWGEVPSTPASPLRRKLQSWQYAPLADARHIAAVGERAAAAYRALVPGVPVSNRPYACDLTAFAPPAGGRGQTDGPVFLFCGQMIARKGIDLLLLAFAQTLRQQPDVRLLLVGREAELPSLLGGLPLVVRKRINYAGFQSPDALPEWFARADVFVLPSRHDGWGVVVNQALGAGLPCIVSDAVGAGELIDDDVNGSVVPAGDAVALARAMIVLAGDAERRGAQSAAALARAAALSPVAAAQYWETVATT